MKRLYHSGIANNRDVEVVWIHSGDLEKDRGWDEFHDLDGIVVPGGFGYRGIEGKILAARWAREKPSALPGTLPRYAG